MPHDQTEMTKTYVTDITHYLDKSGELADMPKPARTMASFLVLLIDATTEACPVRELDTRIRCKTKGCRGSIRSSLASNAERIIWRCPDCGLKGVISNWRETKWDQTRRSSSVR